MILGFEMNIPGSVRGFAVRCWDDGEYYTIVVNANLSEEKKKEVYQHEKDHIENGDFSNVIDASRLEAIAHGVY